MPHKAIPGVPLVVRAGEYNAAMEAGQWFTQQKQLGQSTSGIVTGVNPCVVKIQNDTGGNLAAGTVVELSSALLTTLDRQHLWLSGIARAGNDPGFGVLIEPVKSGEIGLAQVAGVCLASVDIQDADNTHARLVPSSTTLKGDFGGPVEILQKPSGTGVKACVVRLGVRQSIIRRAKAAEDIAAGANGDVNVWLNGASRGTVTAYNTWDAGDVADTDEIRILYQHDLDKWEILKRGGASAPNACWGCWSLGGTGKVFQDGSSTAETDPYPIYTAGMWLHFGGVRGVARVSNELGACFVVPTSGLEDILPAVDIQQYGYYEVTIYTSWSLPSLSLSNARSVLRAAGHDHTYTDNGNPLTTGTATPDVLGLDSYSVASVETVLHLSGGGSHTMGQSSLPLFYSAEPEAYRGANHSATVVVSQLAATLQGLRIQVKRTDSTLFAAPQLGGCHLFIRQLYPFGTDPI